jgi:hypothetical protein
MELQAPNNGVEEQHTAPFAAKIRCHLVGATFDLLKQPVYHIAGTNGLPMLFGKGVERQTYAVRCSVLPRASKAQ